MVKEMIGVKIFGDSPTIEDGLGFKHYADILLELIDNFDAKNPLTIGIHGSWGSGKTSLMKMLENGLGNRKDNSFKTIWFNAWAYGGDVPIGLALLQKILVELEKENEFKEKVRTLIEGSSKLLVDTALRKTIGISFEDAKNLFKESIKIKSSLRADFETAIDEYLQDKRLVVFIDDLDRCLPEKAIEIIEMIKLFLDVPKCIFIIGVERDVIERGIEVRYKSKGNELPISGSNYIDKIIQIPFILPPIRVKDMASFIESLGIGEREKSYVRIVAKGTGCNPRKVKLFLNTLRIRQAIAERTGGKIEPELSAKLFVFEYVFREFYKDVIKYKEQDILCRLENLARGIIDEELGKQLESSGILKKYYENEDLRNLLREKPFFCGKDIEPYIFISGTGKTLEAPISEESALNGLLSSDFIIKNHALDAIKSMPESDRLKLFAIVTSKLKDGDAGMRANAAWALGNLGDVRAVDPLIETLEDDDGIVRANAAEALGKLGNAKAVTSLIEELEDKDEFVCRKAIGALGNLHDTRAVDPLIDALKNKGEFVRRKIAKALGNLGDARAVDPLIETLEDNDEIVRANAAEALGKLGNAKAVTSLIETLKDNDRGVRGSAARALGNLHDMRAVAPLIDALKDKYEIVRRRAAWGLGDLGDTRAVDPLIEALEDKDEFVRGNAAMALGNLADAKAVDPLIRASKDENEFVSSKAREALEKINAREKLIKKEL